MTADVLFNPSFQTASESKAGFAARRDVLDDLLAPLHAPWTDANRHTLVIGPRGFGKSTLMRRVVAEIETTPALADRWVPVVLPEEPYEVGNLGELWLETLHRLATSQQDPELIRLHGVFRSERDEERLSLRCQDALRTWADQKRRRLLLVVENLDMLFQDALTETTEWKLRKTLQTDPHILLYATATRRFDALEAHDRAFYEALHRIELPALSVEEIAEVWFRTTGYRPPTLRCQAVRVLTGGNPRMVRLLASLAQGRTLRAILDELTTLIDRHTDYFKGNIESLNGHKRRSFLALAALWRPATAAEVAQEARLDPKVVGVELGRLAVDGRVEIVPGDGRSKRYQVAERLYNIYYLLRRGGGQDARVRALVDFIAVFYEPVELYQLVGRMTDEYRAAPDSLTECVALVEALLGHRKDEAARHAVLSAVGGDMLEEMPKARRLAKAEPSRMLALLRGKAGDSVLADAEACLRAHAEDEDPAVDELAEEMLRRGEEVSSGAFVRLARFAPDLALTLYKAANDASRARRLAASGFAYAITSRDAAFAQRWREAIQQHGNAATIRLLVPALQLVEDPARPTTLPACLRGRPGPDFLDLITAMIDGASGEKAAAAVLAEVPNPTPHQLAALGYFSGRAGDHATALRAFDKLLQEHPTPAAANAATLSAFVTHGPDAAASYSEIARSLGDTAHSLSLEVLVSDDHEDQTGVSGRAAKLLRACNGDGITWHLLTPLVAAGDLTTAYERLSVRARTRVGGFILSAAPYSRCPDVWRFALKHGGEAWNPTLHLSRSSLHGRLGRPDQALHHLVDALALETADSSMYGPAEIERAIGDLCLSLAVVGLSTQVVAALAASPRATTFAALIAGLGEPTETASLAPEEVAVAADVRARVDALRRSSKLWPAPFARTLLYPPLSAFVADPPTPKPKRPRNPKRTP